MKKRRRFLILASITAIVIVTVIVFSAKKTSADQSAQAAGEALWSHLYAQVGPYGLQSNADITAFAADGFHLTIVNYEGTTGLYFNTLVKNKVKYIDPFVWSEIRTVFSTEIATHQTWTPTAAQEQTVLAAVAAHLALTAQDPNIVGYYVLDDYPYADIHSLLEQVNALITTSNQTAIFPKPSICGFGSYLDVKPNASAVFTTTTAAFSTGLVNFSPAACDIVALYPYANNTSNDPSLVDWSMSNLLPAEFQLLEAKGWNQEQEPLIGVPQAFGYQISPNYYVTPTAQDVATQVEAYCQFGAIALLPYTWDDGTTLPNPHEMYNDPDLVQGMQQGVAACHSQYWDQNIPVAPPVVVTPPPTQTPTTPPPVPPTPPSTTDTTSSTGGTLTGLLSGGGPADTTGSLSGGGTPPAPVAPASVAPQVTTTPAASGFWSFIPFVKHTTPTAPSVIAPTLPVPPSSTTPTNTKKSYTIASADYTLNGILVHTATTFPDGWSITTTTLQNGTYTLTTLYHYTDGTTDTESSTFVVDNSESLITAIVQWVKGVFR